MDSTIEIQGRQLKLSNLQKVLYPATGFTKKDVIDYYVRIAPALVPHLSGRALTMKRYPDGVDGQFFYEKNAPKHRPDWGKTVPVWSEGNHRTMHYVEVSDLSTLVWLANLAALELHPSIFEHFGLRSFPKTSGSKGLQVYVPLNTPTTYEATKPFAHALARLLEHDHPNQVVSDMKKQIRTGKVFVDWSQNDEHKTTIAVYSLRAREHPTVSTPVTWEEVERALKKKDAGLLVFEAPQVVARFEKMGDLFEPVLKLKQKLPTLKELTGAVAPEAAAERIEIAAQAEEDSRKPARRAQKKSGQKRPAQKKSRKV